MMKEKQRNLEDEMRWEYMDKNLSKEDVHRYYKRQVRSWAIGFLVLFIVVYSCMTGLYFILSDRNVDSLNKEYEIQRVLMEGYCVDMGMGHYVSAVTEVEGFNINCDNGELNHVTKKFHESFELR